VTPWFIATEQFTSMDGEKWDKYIAWSRLKQLDEVISLDGLLCPTVLRDITDEYWPHIVIEDFMLHFFTGFHFLMAQVAAIEPKNVLCVFRNPTGQPDAPSVADFRFLGYDLVDRECSISALTNCGVFPDVFANSELSNVGLLTDLHRATEVQRLLRALHPEERHADCHVWAIFRLATRAIYDKCRSVCEYEWSRFGYRTLRGWTQPGEGPLRHFSGKPTYRFWPGLVFGSWNRGVMMLHWLKQPS
jgi:hypothetical protein